MQTINTDSLKEFRILYNRLDELFAEKTGFHRPISFIQKLKRFLKIYPSYQPLKGEIRRVHDLRNLLVHEEKGKNDIAIPTDSFLQRIKDIIKALENPQTALDIASTDIFCCDPNDRILDIVKIMAEKIYSQVPVFDDKENKEGFIGVFSETSLIHLLGKGHTRAFKDGLALRESAKIADILELVKKPINESWDFVSQDIDAYKVRDMFHTKTFENAQLEKSRLGVLFVTENGKSSEQILGIITAWDLSKIDQYQRGIPEGEIIS